MAMEWHTGCPPPLDNWQYKGDWWEGEEEQEEPEPGAFKKRLGFRDSDVVTTAAGILCKMHAGGDMNQLPSKVIYRIQVSQRSPFSMWSGIIIVCSRDVGRTSRGVYYDK